MAFSKTLISPLLSLILSCFFLNEVQSQGDTTSFTFNSFTTQPKLLTFQGDASVPTNPSPLRLTRTDSVGRPFTNNVGRVVYLRPVAFWDAGTQASFETTISFLITTIDKNPADGITFFIVPVDSPIPEGSIGGSFGVFDIATGLAPSAFAVEFDIFVNPGDPNYRHIGININSIVSRNTTRFDGFLGEEVTARINYIASTRTITVLATSKSENASLSYVYDLKTILPRQVQVGLSASTGNQIAIHDINSWHFTSALVWDGNNGEKNEERYIKQYV